MLNKSFSYLYLISEYSDYFDYSESFSFFSVACGAEPVCHVESTGQHGTARTGHIRPTIQYTPQWQSIPTVSFVYILLSFFRSQSRYIRLRSFLLPPTLLHSCTPKKTFVFTPSLRTPLLLPSKFAANLLHFIQTPLISRRKKFSFGGKKISSHGIPSEERNRSYTTTA